MPDFFSQQFHSASKNETPRLVFHFHSAALFTFGPTVDLTEEMIRW
jgi:hypothetical protein